MTRYPSSCGLFELDGAPATGGEWIEPSHIHVARPSRRPLSGGESDGFSGLTDRSVEDDAAAA